MKLIVDRIENNIAVCEKEDLSHTEISISDLPFEIKEGSVIVLKNGIYTLDEEEESKRRSKMLEMQRKLFENKGL